MKKIFYLLVILITTSCQTLNYQKRGYEDDEAYWQPGEVFWSPQVEPKERPVSSDDNYGTSRYQIAPYTNYYDYNYYNRPYVYTPYPQINITPEPKPKPTIQDGQGPVRNSRSGATTPKITHIKRP
jgi:hypothetical protein